MHRITREHRKSDSNSCHNGHFCGVEGEADVQIIWVLTVHAQTRALLIIGNKMKNRYRYPGFLEVDRFSAILFIRCESYNGFLYYNFDTRTLEFILWIVCLKHITIILCKTFVRGDLDIYKTAPIYLLISKSVKKSWSGSVTVYLVVDTWRKEIYFTSWYQNSFISCGT